MNKSIQFKSFLIPGLIASSLAITGCGGGGGGSDNDPTTSPSSRGGYHRFW